MSNESETRKKSKPVTVAALPSNTTPLDSVKSGEKSKAPALPKTAASGDGTKMAAKIVSYTVVTDVAPARIKTTPAKPSDIFTAPTVPGSNKAKPIDGLERASQAKTPVLTKKSPEAKTLKKRPVAENTAEQTQGRRVTVILPKLPEKPAAVVHVAKASGKTKNSTAPAKPAILSDAEEKIDEAEAAKAAEREARLKKRRIRDRLTREAKKASLAAEGANQAADSNDVQHDDDDVEILSDHESDANAIVVPSKKQKKAAKKSLVDYMPELDEEGAVHVRNAEASLAEDAAKLAKKQAAKERKATRDAMNLDDDGPSKPKTSRKANSKAIVDSDDDDGKHACTTATVPSPVRRTKELAKPVTVDANLLKFATPKAKLQLNSSSEETSDDDRQKRLPKGMAKANEPRRAHKAKRDDDCDSTGHKPNPFVLYEAEESNGFSPSESGGSDGSGSTESNSGETIGSEDTVQEGAQRVEQIEPINPVTDAEYEPLDDTFSD